MRQQPDMEELLASVSEEETLEARRDAAVAAGADQREVRRLDGLIVAAMKREVEAEGEGEGDSVSGRGTKSRRSWRGWLGKARTFVGLGTILSLIFMSVGPDVSSASAVAWTDGTHPVAVLSGVEGLPPAPDVVVASATAVTQPLCENMQRPETPPRVGDIIHGGYWTHLQGVAWDYQVTSVERQKSLQWSEWGYESTALGIWSIVHVRVRNAGDRNGMPYPYDAQTMDRSGAIYEVNRKVSFLYSDYHQLYTFTETIPPGVWVELGVVTDIAPDAHGLMLCIKQAGTMVDLGE